LGNNILDSQAANRVGWPIPKRKAKRVTLILGIVCKDSIVLAADSQTTKGVAKQLGTNKISVVDFANGKAAVAESGSILSNVAIELFQMKARGKAIENQLTVAKTAEEAVREVIAGITKHLNPNSTDIDRQNLLRMDDNYFELMIAYYYGFKPCLYTLKSAWCVPFRSTAHFATSGIAGDLANYILQEHTAKDMEKNLASVIAIKTVKDAIDYVEGCGPPIRVALVHKPYRKRPYKLVPKKGNEHLAMSIGEKVYGEVKTEPSSVYIYDAEKVEAITKIISNVEQKTKASRNNSLHKALQDQSDAYFKKMEKEAASFRKKFPSIAAEYDRRIAKTAEVFEILPDNE
jgi:20S proteasome alpha/beta subunit